MREIERERGRERQALAVLHADQLEKGRVGTGKAWLVCTMMSTGNQQAVLGYLRCMHVAETRRARQRRKQ
jgi:hypothetical protein